MNNLTDKWEKGELPYAEYYIKLAGGEYTNDVWDIDGWQSFNKKGDVVVEVLSEVPSYEELQNQAFILKSRESEIVKLKELLKLNNVLNKGSKSIYSWLKEDTAGEQKKLCADMFDKTVEMMSEINQVLGE